MNNIEIISINIMDLKESFLISYTFNIYEHKNLISSNNKRTFKIDKKENIYNIFNDLNKIIIDEMKEV